MRCAPAHSSRTCSGASGSPKPQCWGAVGMIFQGKYPHKLGGRLVTLRVWCTAETICENLLKVSSSSSVPERWLQSRNISWLITVWYRERRLIELILCKRSCWIIRTIHTWRNWRLHEWKSLVCSKWTDFTIADFSLPGTWSLSMLWKREFTRHRFMNWIILKLHADVGTQISQIRNRQLELAWRIGYNSTFQVEPQ